jgi:hypothetical protein
MLDGAIPIRNRDGIIVPVDEYRECYEQYAEIVAFLFDLENKIMTITITEYWQQPATLIDAMRIYTLIRNEMKNEAAREQ